MIIFKDNQNKIKATYNKKTNLITLWDKDFQGGKDFENAIIKKLGYQWFYYYIYRAPYVGEKTNLTYKKGI